MEHKRQKPGGLVSDTCCVSGGVVRFLTRRAKNRTLGEIFVAVVSLCREFWVFWRQRYLNTKILEGDAAYVWSLI